MRRGSIATQQGSNAGPSIPHFCQLFLSVCECLLPESYPFLEPVYFLTACVHGYLLEVFFGDDPAAILPQHPKGNQDIECVIYSALDVLFLPALHSHGFTSPSNSSSVIWRTSRQATSL